MVIFRDAATLTKLGWRHGLALTAGLASTHGVIVAETEAGWGRREEADVLTARQSEN